MTTGAESSMLTVGVDDAPADEEAAAAGAAAGCAGAAEALVDAPGVGLPRRCPDPPNGLYFFLGAT